MPRDAVKKIADALRTQTHHTSLDDNHVNGGSP